MILKEQGSNSYLNFKKLKKCLTKQFLNLYLVNH